MTDRTDLQAGLAEYVDFEGELPASVDEAVVRRMYGLVRLLDEGVPLPVVGWRVGLDPLVGALPVAGDVAAAAASLYLVLASARQGVSRTALARMLLNVGVDVVVGSVPVLGIAFDAAWKANKRNLRLALADLAEGGGDPDSEMVEIGIE